ncbi:peptidylprolyl isomerase [Paracoccus sp. DMF-8]|uniref:peptidylprolyl isomerase n=1 Tax=Paracoccus sp. DMF-8 TaxID=3019445 RepID=UPI0023E82B7D|nr:peptidylprolyl isomerase [Paracoccus sp. DMF-8]MDF3606950.1 peptidylprolyl isomerase [Paracoccus sp. DMF-8]
MKPIFAVAILTAAPAFAQDADTVVATVNGQTITLGQMIAMKEGLNDPSTANLPDSVLWELMLDQMIRQTAVGQPRAEALTKRDEAALEIDRRAYLAGAALEEIATPDPTDDEMRAIYDRLVGDDGEARIEYNAAHILVKTEDEAKAIEAELAGGADFGTLAEQKSTDNSSANKGDLGWFQPAQMVAPFAEAVQALKPGELSKPVETQFGWHVIKLNETRNVEPPKYEEVKEQLAIQVRRERVESQIQKSVDEATIEKVEGIDPALLGKTELLEQ